MGKVGAGRQAGIYQIAFFQNSCPIGEKMTFWGGRGIPFLLYFECNALYGRYIQMRRLVKTNPRKYKEENLCLNKQKA